MNKNEIMDIFAGYLPDRSTDEATLLSQKDIALRLIEKLAGRSIDPSFLPVLRLIAEMRLELELFVLTEGDGQQFLKILQSFYEILIFIQENYENIKLGVSAEVLSRDELLMSISLLKEKLEDFKGQFQEENLVRFKYGLLDAIRTGLSLSNRVLLGEILFSKFKDEFNAASGILRQIRVELHNPITPSDGAGLN